MRGWGVGHSGKDDGFVLAVAMEDKKIFLAVGYGLEGVLNDAKIGQLLDTYAIPSFRQGQFGSGIVRTVWQTAQIVDPDISKQGQNVNQQAQADNTIELSWWQVLLIGGGIILFLMVDASFLWRGTHPDAAYHVYLPRRWAAEEVVVASEEAAVAAVVLAAAPVVAVVPVEAGKKYKVVFVKKGKLIQIE